MCEFTNLEGFEDLEFVCKKGEFELHKIKQKSTGSIFFAMIFTTRFDEIGRNQFINLYREMNIIPNLNHPSILNFIGYSPIDFSNKPRPVIIIESCKYHTLTPIFSNDNTKKLINIYGIASAMSYLHSHNIIHRDLKPDNIFMDDRLFPKITGFHVSKQIESDSPEGSNFIKGTPAYLAPEIYTEKEYSKSSDVYSFSLIVYQILKGVKIFKGYNKRPSFLREFVIRGGRPDDFTGIPEIYEKLIKKCWSNEPKERPNFDQIIDLLKNDRSYILEGVREDEFREYIKYIESSKVTFNPTDFNRNNSLEKFYHSKFETLSNYFNFKIQTVYDTELDSIEIYNLYINLKYFIKGNLIGRGRYCNIYQIFFYDYNRSLYITYAAKLYLTEREKVIGIFSQEVFNHSQLYHPCICSFVGYSPIDFDKQNYPSIILDCYSNSSLDKHILLERNGEQIQSWNQTSKLIIIYGIACGMSYLHSMDIIHRDLNTSNILLDFYLFPKIGDFATAKDVSDDSSFTYVINKNPIYTAPEILMDNKYSKESDVYSFAMILYEIVTNEIPFKGLNQYEIVKSVIEDEKRPPFNKEIQNCYKNLIEKCWSQDPKLRPSFDEIVHILKTDQNFISNGIEKEKFSKYISFVEGEKITFQPETDEDIFRSRTNIIVDNQNGIEFKDKNILSINSNSIDLSQFEFDRKSLLGEGSFGKVFKVIEKKTNNFFAAKILNHPLETCEKTEIININREIKNSMKLNFPSIIKFVGYSLNNFENKPNLTLITEFASKGTLHQIISMQRNKIENIEWNDTKKLIVIFGIAAGMKYLHSKNIIHRDLKPSNIFLDDSLHPKIGDLGLSKEINAIEKVDETDKIDSNYRLKGTFSYLAPEIISKHCYSKAGDVYAFALILFQLMMNEHPYNDLTRYQIMLKIPNGFRPEIKDDIPSCYKNLIEKCWSNDPKKRLTFDEIVDLLKTNEEFITKNVDKSEFLKYVNEIEKFF